MAYRSKFVTLRTALPSVFLSLGLLSPRSTLFPYTTLFRSALARKLPPDEVYEWLKRLKVRRRDAEQIAAAVTVGPRLVERSEEHTSELQSHSDLVCRLLLEKKKN